MKKLKLMRLALITLVGASLLFSCKSTPDIEPVDPFELLDSDAALYLSVPVQANREFVSAAIQKVAKLSESDAEKISDRLDTAFVAIGTSGEIQLSASGTIPTAFVGLALNEKNGWKGSLISNQTCYTHQQTLYQLCLPSSTNAFLSHYIEPMVNRFNRLAYVDFNQQKLSEEEKKTQPSGELLLSQELGERVYQFLHDNKTSDIMMYAPVPKAFVRAFLGTEVNTPVDSLYAVLSQYRGVKEQFNVRLIINLTDPRVAKATCALLKTALFGVPAKVVQSGQKQITITDLPVTQKRILSLIR